MNHPAIRTRKTAMAVEIVAVIIYESYLEAGEGAAGDSEAAELLRTVESHERDILKALSEVEQELAPAKAVISNSVV